MFGASYPNDVLASVCRAVRHAHGAGLPLVRVLRMQAKNGPAAYRETFSKMADDLERGSSLEDALKPHRDQFPEILMSMATVGERTGQIPEVFGHLEDYFKLQHQLNREFRSRAMWPIFQFVVAVGIVALTILITGELAPSKAEAISPIGFGLKGTSGAIIFLSVMGSLGGAIFLAYWKITSDRQLLAKWQAKMLRWPLVGPCIEAVCMGRFCLAMQLTLDSSLPIEQALKQSLRATGNKAYTDEADYLIKRIAKGADLTEAIETCPVFPPNFTSVLTVGEESGQLPEVMAKQASYYQEETTIRLNRLMKGVAGALYGLVALFLIVVILRMANVYISALSGIE